MNARDKGTLQNMSIPKTYSGRSVETRRITTEVGQADSREVGEVDWREMGIVE